MSEAAEYAPGGDRESGPQSEDAIRDDAGMNALSPELREQIESAQARAEAAGYAIPDESEPEPTDESHWSHEMTDAPPEDGQPLCFYCGSAIESMRFAYRRVVAWERKRRAGGTNAVRLREPLDEYACAPCVDAVAAGRDPGQRAML